MTILEAKFNFNSITSIAYKIVKMFKLPWPLFDLDLEFDLWPWRFGEIIFFPKFVIFFKVTWRKKLYKEHFTTNQKSLPLPVQKLWPIMWFSQKWWPWPWLLCDIKNNNLGRPWTRIHHMSKIQDDRSSGVACTSRTDDDLQNSETNYMTLTFDLYLNLTLRLTFDLDDLKKTNCFKICDLFEVTWRKNVTSYVKSETTYRMRLSARNIFQPTRSIYDFRFKSYVSKDDFHGYWCVWHWPCISRSFDFWALTLCSIAWLV